MAKPDQTPYTFIVPGLDAARSRGGFVELNGDRYKHDIRVGAARGEGQVAAEAKPGEDIVILEIENGPELRLHPAHAADLLRAQSADPSTDRSVSAGVGKGAAILVPSVLAWHGIDDTRIGTQREAATRGIGGVVLKAFKVLTGIGKSKIADLAVDALVRKVDGQVNEAVYRLDRKALVDLKGSATKPTTIDANGDRPTLVLIHGTFSSTQGTFYKMWSEQPAMVQRLFDFYRDQVYALDHCTLGASPIANAITLAERLPTGAKLHLLTHSRGGLVAEIFARVCADPAGVGHFDGSEPFVGQRDELDRLVALLKGKNITVERMVRVACPVRGTLLASGRLDAYLSIIKWALELAQMPVLPELVELLSAIANERTDPSVLPGLEAQMPDSRLVSWLHKIDQPIPGDLRVIAGDIQGDSVISWLKVLAADWFYWTDHDLVVQTRAMYGGAPRVGSAQFVFDKGASVSHFNYFRNDRTARAVVDGLTQAVPPGYQVIGPQSWAGETSDGLRGRHSTTEDDVTQSHKPLVFLIPGIVGSNLKEGSDRIWLGWHLLNGFGRLAYPDGDRTVAPDGPIGSTYDRLSDFLAETHAVVEFDFDWRKPIEDEAQRLAEKIRRALEVREDGTQPVQIIAHSMGGLVARAVELVDATVWGDMMARDGARLLMLGTPNGGSWAPMQVLSGDDTLGNALAMAGAPFHSHDARQIIAGFPGLIQLQADLASSDGPGKEKWWSEVAQRDLSWLASRSLWHRLPLQLTDSSWGLPVDDVLAKARKLRRDLDDQLKRPTALVPGKIALVVGHAELTPDGYSWSDENGFQYRNVVDAGDGRVTHASARIDGVPTWKLDVDHGNLPRAERAFAAFRELLLTGQTQNLPAFSTTRGAGAEPAVVLNRASRDGGAPLPPALPVDVLESSRRSVQTEIHSVAPPIRVKIINGDLSFIGSPLMLGHYRSSQVTGAERVMNRLIGGTMQQALNIGRYPDAVSTTHVFTNTRAHPYHSLPRPRAVIVVGLGDESTLTPRELVEAVKNGALAWAQRVSEHSQDQELPGDRDIAATLIGSGGVKITAGEAAQCIVQGIGEANELITRQQRQLPSQASDDELRLWPRIESLTIVELYLDRATEAWQAVSGLNRAAPNRYILDPTIEEGEGRLRRPPESGYRGSDYDFVSALTTREGGETRISFSADSRRARTEIRDRGVQLKLVRGMVRMAAGAGRENDQLGRALFNLLVPVTIVPVLGGSTSLVLELDAGTMGIPWELLSIPGNSTPWAIRSSLLRKLRLPAPRPPVADANTDSSVLIIGEPETSDTTNFPRLDGARTEALVVNTLLRKTLGDKVHALIRAEGDPGPSAEAIATKLFDRDWRIIHITGHGVPPEWVDGDNAVGAIPNERAGDPRGVVLSNGCFLGPRELGALTPIPELVFVNCCYIAAAPTDKVLEPRHGDFAVGVAEELIRIGVRCVITPAWAVEDAGAKTFAIAFYESLLSGARFIESVCAARRAANDGRTNTWAAYQAYGDPDWRFRTSAPNAQGPATDGAPPIDVFPSAESLIVAINALCAAVGTDIDDQFGLERQLNRLEDSIASWSGRGDVHEAFGRAWMELGQLERARAHFEKALSAPDGGATINAVEQFANALARLAWQSVRETHEGGGDINTVAPEAMAWIERSLRLVDQLIGNARRTRGMGATLERHALRGSAQKRRAMILSCLHEDPTDAIAAMQKAYTEALTIGDNRGAVNLYYPGLGVIAARLRLADNMKIEFDQELLAKVRTAMDRANETNPDFWSTASPMELDIYEAIARGELAKKAPGLTKAYGDLHSRVHARRRWASIYDLAYFILERYAEVTDVPAERAAAMQVSALLRSYAT